MAPTICNRGGDTFEEGCDPRDELAEVDALLERLRLKRYELKRKINRFHSPIVRQLPPDVTSTIFEFCLPDFADHSLSPYIKKNLLKNHSIPLSLGAICSYWRDIAWSTPSLWSSLVVRNPSKFNSHTIASIAREWLARSGGLPLSIRILSTVIHNETVMALVDVINQYSTRWSDLDLVMPDRCYRRFRATNHAPILESIRFYCISISTTKSELKFALTCPRLKKASLSYFPGKNSIQWDNLSHLTLYSMFINDSFLILRKTPRLVSCEVSGSCRPSRIPDEQTLRTPVLTSLRSLHLLINSSAAISFLGNLIAPHLEEFSFPRHCIPTIEVVTSFFRRSACSLRSLSMIFTTFPPQYVEGFMNLLQSMPSLTTLSMLSTTAWWIATPEKYHPRYILQLVAKVLSTQSTSLQQGFLPNLEILEYTGKLYLHPGNYEDLYPLPPTDDAVHGPLHLLKLNLYSATRIPENMISYISSIAERGVKVNVLSNSEDILQSSIDYYRRRKDSLCWDWSDNLDLSLFCGLSQKS